MAVGGHGTINHYLDGETRIVIRPNPVLYTLKEVVVGMWDIDKTTTWDDEGEETIKLCEYMWQATMERYSNRQGMVEYLLYHVYENAVRNPDWCPTISTNSRYEEIPDGCRGRIEDFVLRIMPTLRGDTHPHRGADKGHLLET